MIAAEIPPAIAHSSSAKSLRPGMTRNWETEPHVCEESTSETSFNETRFIHFRETGFSCVAAFTVYRPNFYEVRRFRNEKGRSEAVFQGLLLSTDALFAWVGIVFLNSTGPCPKPISRRMRPLLLRRISSPFRCYHTYWFDCCREHLLFFKEIFFNSVSNNIKLAMDKWLRWCDPWIWLSGIWECGME